MCSRTVRDREDTGWEWTREEAEIERVKYGRRCLLCKVQREDTLPDTEHRTLETGELMCSRCLRKLRRFKRDRDVLLRVDSDLDNGQWLQEAVDDFFLTSWRGWTLLPHLLGCHLKRAVSRPTNPERDRWDDPLRDHRERRDE